MGGALQAVQRLGKWHLFGTVDGREKFALSDSLAAESLIGLPEIPQSMKIQCGGCGACDLLNVSGSV